MPFHAIAVHSRGGVGVGGAASLKEILITSFQRLTHASLKYE